ncbi:cytosolic Fe-S cluster assembling factor CFD1 [Moesziomyces antarcticus]|uniref:Cytosolic Fe-S cluster assembling factor CFD1 n=2 Tax=Pseudozyma antarctica TaxID=84753 RepID=A0A081CG00_PSEA2|nr:cytosolic Fe-S cluster assembling factor CFD1 [Moesziomyces antarcticus]GAK65596.1 cytosolic Fe-S cluster assembling factor CFD1 [Moesziomyces antarcticus]SPO46611.1 related to nucleotide binding protein (NBP 2) [Moesziomyces antarcticus]
MSASGPSVSPSASHLGADPKIVRRLSQVSNIILVLSGKGGVGKSSVSAQLALSLSSTPISPDGRLAKVGILDVDLTGPSIPRMLGLDGATVKQSTDGWVPVYTDASQQLAVMSVGFLLRSRNDSVVWRGPKKNAMIKQFLGDVRWGALDYLIIDTPPGTSDEHISILEYLRTFSPSAVMVTTPQAVSLADNLRSLDFCRKTQLPVLGLIENMSGYICPHCKDCTNVWGKGGGEALAKREGIHFLGRIPIDPGLVRVLDDAKEDAQQLLHQLEDKPDAIDQPLTTQDSSVTAGTLLSRSTIHRYRDSLSFPIFQDITNQIRDKAATQKANPTSTS